MNADFFSFVEDIKNIRIYTYDNTTLAPSNYYNGAKIFEKPKGCFFVYFIVVGGGGGGGGSGNSGNSAGGGGGSNGCPQTALVPSIFCPDVLYIRVGQGGAGGSGASNGTNGSPSLVLLNPYSTIPVPADTFLYGSGGLGGASGTNGSAGGGIATQPSNTTNPLGFYSLTTVNPSVAASSGSAVGNGTAISLMGGGLSGGGGGGAGSSGGGAGSGGGFTPSDLSWGFYSVPGGTANTGVNGDNGYFRRQPEAFYGIGGAGGCGSFDPNLNSNGGNGAPGCGGGGAGSYSAGNTKTGGKGGDGFVIIGII